MFKVNNKDSKLSRTRCKYFTRCSIVFVVNFEQLNANWAEAYIQPYHASIMEVIVKIVYDKSW